MTPWEAFKGKPKPWKIGLITFPVGSPWLANVIKQTGVEFDKAKAKGLVEGTLQKYIQPSYATATPEQQIAAIQQMVRDGVDGILLLPLAGPPLAPAIDAAGKAGVPVVILDNVDRPRPSTRSTSGRRTTRRRPPASPGLVKKGNVLFVRGIAGNPVEQAFQDAAVADIKACPGLKIVGTIYGKWTNAIGQGGDASSGSPRIPDTKIDAVIQNGIMMAGIVQAFQQAGRPVPPISGGGCQGGDLSWWLKNKATYKTVANCFNGFQTAWSEFRLLARILDGRGLKVRGHPHPGPDRHEREPRTSSRRPGKPLSWPGEPRGPIDGWASNKFLDGYFNEARQPRPACNARLIAPGPGAGAPVLPGPTPAVGPGYDRDTSTHEQESRDAPHGRSEALDSLIDPAAEPMLLGAGYEFTEGPVWMRAVRTASTSATSRATRAGAGAPRSGGMEVCRAPDVQGQRHGARQRRQPARLRAGLELPRAASARTASASSSRSTSAATT